MPVIKKYPIGRSRFLYASMEGFAVGEDGTLETAGEGRHICFLGCLDSARRSCEWGRFRFSADLSGEAVVIVRGFATDDATFVMRGEEQPFENLLLSANEPVAQKLRLFELAKASKFVSKTDVLLYEQTGRYLWLCLEVVGGRAAIRDVAAYAPRDNFFSTFPEIYRTNGEFFHRYLSIYSSMYYDLQDKIDAVNQLVDIDAAPAELLPTLAGWIGLELDGGFLDEPHLRRLLKEALSLLRKKGTKSTLEGILKLFVDAPFFIVEQCMLMERATREVRPIYGRLYGTNPYGVTVLIDAPPNEQLQAQLKFILRQFTLLRTKVNIVFLGKDSRLDGYCFLDVNARIPGVEAGKLDRATSLDGRAYLQ